MIKIPRHFLYLKDLSQNPNLEKLAKSTILGLISQVQGL